MSSIDPRTPVLVGVGQFKQKPADPTEALEPAAMMIEVVRRAAADAGAPSLLAKLDAVRVVKGAWPYLDPGRIVAEAVGANPVQTALSTDGGNTPQSLVNRSCLDILAGKLDTVVIVGAEGIWSRRRAKRAGQRIPYTDDAGVAPAEVLGKDLQMSSRLEAERGVEQPINLYPIFENALRASQGEAIDAHIERVSELWATFNAVAVQNPYAWVRTPLTAEEIRTPTAQNRMVGWPYTKSMNSNWDLDQAAALLLCAAGTAEAMGVPRDRWVFPWAGTDAHDTLLVSNRDNLYSSPAIRTAGAKVFELTGLGPDDIGHIDLYSCFPSAVQIAAKEIGFDQSRQLTVTGGLPFAGGPLNNYVTHGIAAMADVLRADPGSIGYNSANGGYVTKHAMGIYSTEPPPQPFRHADVQDVVDTFPTREVSADHRGPATVESYTVMHGAEGPEVALIAALTPDGQRTWTRSTDAATMASMMGEEPIGKPLDIDADGVAHL